MHSSTVDKRKREEGVFNFLDCITMKSLILHLTSQGQHCIITIHFKRTIKPLAMYQYHSHIYPSVKHTHTCIHTQWHWHTHTHTHTMTQFTHKHLYISTHTCTLICTEAHMSTHIVQTCNYAYTHKTHAHVCIHTHTDTHSHAHKYPPNAPPPPFLPPTHKHIHTPA